MYVRLTFMIVKNSKSKILIKNEKKNQKNLVIQK